MWERCSWPRLPRCLFRSQSGDICWDMQTPNPFGLELFTFSPAREGSYKCQRYWRLSCASQGAACRTHKLGLLQAPTFASKFLFPPCPWHCFGLWRGRAEEVWCGAVARSARVRCCCRAWCVLSSVNSTALGTWHLPALGKQCGVCVRGSCCTGIWGGSCP